MQPPKKIYLHKRKHKLYNTGKKFRKPSTADASPTTEENQTHGTLCFFLGLMLGPFGVIAAAVVSKAAGACCALYGFAIWSLIGYFIFR